MSVSVTIRGTAYTLMQDRDEDYGTYGTNLLNGMISAINASVFMQTGTRYTRIDYTGATSTNTQSILFGSEGAGVNGDDSIGIRNVNGALQYKEAGGDWTDIGTALSANTDLSNLSATTAVNDDIKPGADDTLFLGLDATEWQAIWTRMIRHGSAIDPDLEIVTTSDNGNIILDPHGTGNIQLGANTVIDTTIEISSGVIEETTDDLTIEASGAGKDITIRASEDMEITATNGDLVINSGDDMTLNATGDTLISGATIALDSASDIITTDVGGISCPLVYSAVIQDYTAVGAVGSASQQFAGHTLAIADFSTLADVVAVYNLSNNQDLSANANHLTDEDAYEAGTGILGVATTAHKGKVNEHLNKDAIAGMTAGGDVSLTIGGWHQTQAASAGLFGLGVLTDTKIQYYTDSNKKIVFDVAGNLSTSVTTMDNGVYNHITLVYDATNSVARGYVNAKLETEFACPTNLNISATPKLWINSKTDGTLELANTLHDECFVYDTKMTTAEIEKIYAASIPLPATLQGKDFMVSGRYKNLGVAADIREFTPEITQIRATDILLKPSIAWQATDERRLVGRV